MTTIVPNKTTASERSAVGRQGVAPDAGEPDAGDAAAIDVAGLVKRYGERTVIDGVSLQVRRGEIVGLLGPNGAGKTTTIEIIEGFRRADAGRVRVLGLDPRAADRSLRARVGIMIQSGGFDMRARPRETIAQYGRFHADPVATDELVDRLGLAGVAVTPYRRLSGGERQRLAFAVALVGRPEVLVLDEPTAGMDPEARAIVRSLVAELRSDGLAILLSSHDLADVARLADRIYIMVDGRIVADGSPAELAMGLEPRLRITLDRPLDEADIRAVDLVVSAVGGAIRILDGGRYEITGVRPTPALVAAVAGACVAFDRLIVESRTVGGSLEDAYMELVGGDRTRPAVSREDDRA